MNIPDNGNGTHWLIHYFLGIIRLNITIFMNSVSIVLNLSETFNKTRVLRIISGVDTCRFQHRCTDFGYTNLDVPIFDHNLCKNYKKCAIHVLIF